MNNTSNTCDYLFIGLGAANCLLILRLHHNGLLTDKKIVIIEPESKTKNDRTFCFWATDEECTRLNITELISYRWDFIKVSGITKQEINPLRYFHVKGIDLYDKTKNALSEYNVIKFSTLLSSRPQLKSSLFEVKLANETLFAHKVFDSRPPSFLAPKKEQSHLLQSFYGLKIKTTSKGFDSSTIVMMDFNVPQNNSTQFIYVLPYTEDTALVELTRFGSEKLEVKDAEIILNNYLKESSFTYTVIEDERGVIPMSSAQIEIDDFGENWIPMGARANMLKPTTGYAFHAMAEDAVTHVEAIKNNQLLLRKSRKRRFIFYDRLLLKILHEKPEYGKVIFETLFKKVAVPKVLSFLREGTSIADELVIFYKLPKRLFIQAALTDTLSRLKLLPVIVLPFFVTILMLLLNGTKLEYFSWSLLLIGFLSIGLSHGALDHITSEKITNKTHLVHFVAGYLLKGAILGVVWFFLPDVALVIFIAYSAWHFGQADFKEWNLKQGLQSFIWGFCVLMAILFFHFNELNWILRQIPNLNIDGLMMRISDSQLLFFQSFIIICSLILAVVNKSKYILLTLIYLLLTSMLPLLISFGIYFVGQHSINGWRHLLLGLNEQSSRLWMKSLPFSIGGALLILAIPFLAGPNYIGMFFIILSCLSIPHVFSMHRFYSDKLP